MTGELIKGRNSDTDVHVGRESRDDQSPAVAGEARREAWGRAFQGTSQDGGPASTMI